MSEIWELIEEKLMYGLYVCLTVIAVILLCSAVVHLVIYYLTQRRISAAKQIYNSIRLNEPAESAMALFRGYNGSKDQYIEETLLPSGKKEQVLCLLIGIGRGEMGEIRLTYVENRLVQKQQNGIW